MELNSINNKETINGREKYNDGNTCDESRAYPTNNCISMDEEMRMVEPQMTKTVPKGCNDDLLTSFATANLLAWFRNCFGGTQFG